jgi:probable HAF family extracellular repeat protein
LVLGVIPVRGAGSLTFKTIDGPGAIKTEAHGINDHGQIVGSYVDPAIMSHGFLLDNGHFTNIDASTLGARDTEAFGINDHSQVVGWYRDTAGNVHGFLFSGGSYSPIDFPGATGTQAFGISLGGHIVGGYFKPHEGHGFLLDRGRYKSVDFPDASFSTEAHGINTSVESPVRPGEIIGQYLQGGSGGISHGFLLGSGRPGRPANPFNIDFPFGAAPGSTAAQGISRFGQIVGFYRDPNTNLHHGFLLVRGPAGICVSTIDVPGAFNTKAFGINNGGKVVGSYNDKTGRIHGFLATPAP